MVDSPAPEHRIGTVVDERFRIEDVVGVGGTSIVYRASDETSGEQVALKVLRAELEGGTEQRFRREAGATAELEHPHVVRVLQAGALPEGIPFVVMELLSGQTLKERLACDGPLSVEEAVAVGDAVLRGLAAAHEADVIHRDVKPANVFLERPPDGEGAPHVRLLDFGLSKVTTPTAEESLTRTGDIVGTPQYLAPEQASGARDVDARADLWSVGVTLYEALSGSRPFDAPHLPAMLLQILSQRPKPLSALRPEVPAGLEQVIERAMAKKRDQRFESAEAMRRALSG